jgi:hypothetical protein
MTRHDQPAAMALRAALWSTKQRVPGDVCTNVDLRHHRGKGHRHAVTTPQGQRLRRRHASINARISSTRNSRKLKSP